MTVAERKSLGEQILEIIRSSREPISVPQIEVELKKQGQWDADTFDVRDAVAELVEEHHAEFVPGRLVRSSVKQ